MPVTRDESIPSRVSILQHPLHPITVVFPIAFLSTTLVTDMTFWWLGDPFWARVSFWLTAAGFSIGVLAAILGIIDFILMKKVRRHVTSWSHFVTGMMVIALAGANLQLRWDDPVMTVLPWGMFISSLMALMVSVTGWLGGTLTFRHGIGSYTHEYDRPAADYEEDAEIRE